MTQPYRVAVTYESMSGFVEPETVRVTVTAGSAGAAARRALDQVPAMRHWGSCVLVLERDEVPARPPPARVWAAQERRTPPGSYQEARRG
jgi:hypothetical protein